MKVIFDTNVWISFLIGKRLSFLKEYLANGEIQISTTEQLIIEIKEVTRRKNLKNIFHQKV